MLQPLQPLWQPLLWAILLGALLAPLNSRLAVRLGGRPKLASTITTIGVVLLLLRDVPLHGIDLRHGDGKHPVAFLPREVCDADLVVHPAR